MKRDILQQMQRWKEDPEAWEKGTNTPAGTARRMMSMLSADNKLPEKYHIISR